MNDMDKEELKTTNLWNVTLTADESGNPLYLTFGGVRYVKEGQQSASGQADTTGKVKEVKWPDKIDNIMSRKGSHAHGQAIGWNACHDAFMKIING